jgi:hypothetical protein
MVRRSSHWQRLRFRARVRAAERLWLRGLPRSQRVRATCRRWLITCVAPGPHLGARRRVPHRIVQYGASLHCCCCPPLLPASPMHASLRCERLHARRDDGVFRMTARSIRRLLSAPRAALRHAPSSMRPTSSPFRPEASPSSPSTTGSTFSASSPPTNCAAAAPSTRQATMASRTRERPLRGFAQMRRALVATRLGSQSLAK